MKNIIRGIVLILLMSAVCSPLLAQQIIANQGPEDITYSRITDFKGNATSNLRMGKGQKAYFNEKGRFVYGTGQHELINTDGKGQYISLTPLSAELGVFLGFRIDNLKFHFSKNKWGYFQVIIDSVKLHNNKIEAIVSEKKADTTFSSMLLMDGLITLVGIKGFLFLPPSSIIDKANTPEVLTKIDLTVVKNMDSKFTKMFIDEKGTIDQQTFLVHLFSLPTSGEVETLVREAIIINSFKDNMRLLEIRDAQGNTTSYITINKGQSAYFDENGLLVYGTGAFRLVNVDSKGQLLTGWLAPSGSRYSGKRADSLSFDFYQSKDKQYHIRIKDILEHSSKN